MTLYAWGERIIVAGITGTGTTASIALAGLARSGQPDTTFRDGTGWFAVTPGVGELYNSRVGISEAAGGSLVFTGSTNLGDVFGLVCGPFSGDGTFSPQPTSDGLLYQRMSYTGGIRTYYDEGSWSGTDSQKRVVVAGRMTISGSSFEAAQLSRLVVAGVTAGESVSADPDALTVAPNSLTHAARVALTVAETAHATVRVVDALGRTVAVLADGALAAGPHTLALDAARLPPGVYAVVATVGETRSVTRVTVVR